MRLPRPMRLLINILLGTALFLVLAERMPGLSGWLRSLESWTLDRRFAWRGSRPLDPRLLVIGLTHTDWGWLNRPSFSLTPVFAELIDGARTASASAIFLDFTLTCGNDPPIRAMVASGLAPILASQAPQLSPRALWSILNNHVGFDLPLLQALIRAKAADFPVYLSIAAPETVSEIQQVRQMTSLLVRTPPPYTNLVPDADQVIRAVDLFARDDAGQLVPAAGLALGMRLSGVATFSVEAGRLRLGETPVPGLQGRRGIIDFAGPAGSVDTLSLRQTLEGLRQGDSTVAALLRDRVLLVGDWTYSDRHRVPWYSDRDDAQVMQGVEIHAHIADCLLQRGFLQQTSAWNNRLAIWLLLVLHALAWEVGPIAGLTILAAAGGAWVAAGLAAFRAGWIVPLAIPWVGLLLQMAFGLWRHLRSGERQRQTMRQIFSRYVNDQVVERLLCQPRDSLHLGERRQVTVMFCDLRNFTAFSENKDPAEVVGYLNRVLSGMTEIIMAHEGVVDKFLGDGLMAFFNAPLDTPDHPRRAAEAALAIVDLMAAVHREAPPGTPEVKVGVALHLGEAIVGNLGSERKMEYTAIGDVVNTTSRLEALNKKHGTAILVSGLVRDAIGPGFVLVYKCEEEIRGRQQTLPVFALLGREPQAGGDAVPTAAGRDPASPTPPDSQAKST